MKKRRALKDGLYQVSTKRFTAGFVVRGGEIVACAPILRRGLDFHMKNAVYICPDPNRAHEHRLQHDGDDDGE